MGTFSRRLKQMRTKVLTICLVALTLCPAGSHACSCNGIVNSKGQGECQTSYRGKKFCYVNEGECSDEKMGSSPDTFWSYEACENYCPRSPVVQGRSRHCCTPEQPCGVGEGDCDSDNDCGVGLKCGNSNCAQFRPDNYARADCCYKPEVSDPSEALPDFQDQVYTLDQFGNIECNQDSDCPPTAQPSWEWNEMTKMDNHVSSITEMKIEVSFCASGASGASGFCDVRFEPFCGHEYGQSHPECQRCNVLTPLPEPRCLKYGQSDAIDIDRCCRALFDDAIFDVNFIPRFLPSQKEDLENFREEILQNFTINECRLSGLHLPPDAPPRTSFDPEFCCRFGSLCKSSISDGDPPTFLSAVTGIGSLRPNFLSRSSPSCPTGHCIRPSRATPQERICCLLIEAQWRRRNILICPNSCD